MCTVHDRKVVYYLLMTSLTSEGTNVFSYTAVMFVPLGSSAAIYCMVLMLTGILLGRILFKEEITIEKAVSTVLTLAGGALVTFSIIYNGSIQLNKAGEVTHVYSENDFQGNVHAKQLEEFNVQKNLTHKNVTNFINCSSSKNLVTDNNIQPSRNIQLHLVSCNSDGNITTDGLTENADAATDRSFTDYVIGVLLSSAAAVTSTLCMVAAKVLSNHQIHWSVITLWSSLGQIILSMILMFCLENITFFTGFYDIVYAVGHSMFCALAIVTTFATISYGEVQLVTIIFTFALPLRVFFQYVGFSHLQPVQTGWMDAAGALLVTISVILTPSRILLNEWISGKFKKADGENHLDEDEPLMASHLVK